MSYAPSLKASALLELRRRQRTQKRARATLDAFVEATAAVRLEPWQHIICARLGRLVGETGQRILIHGPPQYGKSLIISQRFPAYALAQKPTLRLRVACYNISHAERFGKVNLALLRDAQVQQRFAAEGAQVPSIAPAGEWSTKARADLLDANPSFVALGLGTGFTGMGVDTLIIDDPYKNAQEARSPAVNAMLLDWWRNVVVPRLNPDANVVVMFHRWWEGDFAGYLMAQGGWEVLRFPAIGDGGADDPTGRAVGEPLSPRFTIDHLEAKRREMGTDFEALYQGTPHPAEGALFKAKGVVLEDVAPAQARRVRRWDVAATSNGGDFTTGIRMSTADDGVYHIEDVVRGQWSPDERDAQIKATALRDGIAVHQLLPQDPGASGKAQAQAFVRLLAGFPVSTELESGDKVVRAGPLASQWNAGNVRIVRGEWNRAYLDEMLAFPLGRNDDQVDGSSGAFNWLVPNIVTYTEALY